MRASIERALVSAAAVLVACAEVEKGTPPTLRVTHRLADEAARLRGKTEAPNANMGDVTRYVPIAPVVQGVFPSPGESPDVTADAEGVLRIALRCPAPLAGRRAVAQVTLPNWGREDVISCPEDADATVPLVVSGRRPGERVSVIVLVRGMARERAETGWLQVPAPAVLRVALGSADPGAVAEVTPIRFRMFWENRRGTRTMVLDETLDPARRPDDRTWRDVEVTLDTLDDEVRFILESEAAGGGPRPPFAVWGDPVILSRASGPASLNVLLVSIDTLRPDALGCYGRTRPTSPVLDRLASEGTLFEVAVAAAPWTLPSHLTMLSGLYSCVHGQVTGGLGHRLGPGIRPLADFLRASGYATAAFTEDAYMESGVFQRGFGLYRANATGDRIKVENTVASARAWLTSHANVPFFLFVHTYQTHGPYYTPSPYREMFSSPEGTDPAAPPWPSPMYDAAVAYTDATLAPLLALVDELGLRERTLVVITSDHGEAFGEHGHHGHGKSLYEEELRVPLIWRAPGRIAAGRRVGDLVGLIDVTPTILDLVGIAASPGLAGRSLVPWLDGAKPPPVPAPRTLFSENRLRTTQFAVRTERWKAIWEDGKPPRLFSLATDPREARPLHDGPELEEALRMRERFEAECEQQRATLGGDAPPVPSVLPPDPEQQERLRALGYVE